MLEICKTCNIPLNKPYQNVNFKVDNIKQYLYIHNFGKIYEHSVELLKNKNNKKYNNYNYIELNLGNQYSNRYIVWFTSNNLTNYYNIPYEKNAYSNYNIGLVKTNKNGYVKFNLPINTMYKEYSSIGYASHIHYLITKKNYNQEEPFLNRFFTKNILPKYNTSQFKQIIKDKNIIVLNSLNLYSFNIPYTYYFPTNIAKTYNKKQIDSFILNLLDNYPKIYKKLKDKKIKLYEIPILVFCHNKECESAKNLAKILYKNEYINLHYYPEGWTGYNL